MAAAGGSSSVRPQPGAASAEGASSSSSRHPGRPRQRKTGPWQHWSGPGRHWSHTQHHPGQQRRDSCAKGGNKLGEGRQSSLASRKLANFVPLIENLKIKGLIFDRGFAIGCAVEGSLASKINSLLSARHGPSGHPGVQIV